MRWTHRSATAKCRSSRRCPGAEPISKSLEESAGHDFSKSEDATRYRVDTDAIGPTFGPTDPVEIALAKALEGAAAAGRWDLVAQLTRELEASPPRRAPLRSVHRRQERHVERRVLEAMRWLHPTG